MRRLHILNIIGTLLLALSGAMLLPALWALIAGTGDFGSIALSAVITAVFGLILRAFFSYRGDISLIESFILVTLAWLAAAVFGAFPYYIYGVFDSYLYSFFESISGFTTTGATLIENIESMPPGILLWRSLTQWLGGMGIIVLFVALLPRLGAKGMNLFRAEMPGVFTDRVVPRIADMAKKLWIIYMSLTLLLLILLMVFGSSFFHALNHALTTMPTGGFSTFNDSIAGFGKPAIEIVISIFMLLAGINFALYYQLYRKDYQGFYKNPELKFYLIIVVIAVILVSINISSYYGLGENLRTSAFQVIAIITTTGYATANFDIWPSFSRLLLLIFMFFGASGGSTAGGMKQVRIILLVKFAFREVNKLIHPSAVSKIKLGSRPVSEEIMRNVLAFSVLYIGFFVAGSLALTAMGLDITTASSAVAATIGNVGPGLGLVGPENTFAAIPPLGLAILCFMMILGRLEIYTVIIFILAEIRRV